MASPEIIDIESFAQKLELILFDITCTIQAAQTTVPLHVDKEWIMCRVREQIGDGGYTIMPESSSKTSNGLGPFFTAIPRELRDMIFADCLASGFPQFMASSRAMREEGLGQIWAKGVYRMNFGIIAKDGPECFEYMPENAEKIQHIRIRVKATMIPSPEFWSSIELEAIEQFGGSEIRRKTCKVLLDIGDAKYVYIGNEFFDALKTLVGFEEVELRVVFPGRTFPRRWQKNRNSYQTRMVYGFCGEYLESTLGRPHSGSDEGGQFIRFFPGQL